jgi:hypothetical protein
MNRNKGYGGVLFFALILQILGILIHYDFFLNNGYLASPFIGDKNDTFMDFFNTLYWTFTEGRYTSWNSVYPPLNFIFFELIGVLDYEFVQQLVGLGGNSIGLRQSYILAEFIIVMYLLCPVFLMNNHYWSEFSFIQKTFIYLIFILSIPFLFGLERGNIIIITLPLLGMMIGGSPRKSILPLSILINIKPYFVLLTYGYLCKHDKRNFIKVVLLSGFIYISSGVFFGDENFLLMIPNLFGFNNNDELFSVTELLAVSSSITSFSQAIKTETIQYSVFFQKLSLSPELLINAISFIKWFVVLLAFYSIWINAKRLPIGLIFSCIIIIITNISNTVGGYSLIFYLAILPLISKLKYSRYFYLSIFIMFSTLLDWIPVFNVGMNYPFMESWLSGEKTPNIIFTLGIGTIIRPWINLFLLILLSIEFFLLRKGINLKEVSIEKCVN